MGYNPNIRLDPKQLNLNAVREINDLLAHLHHQKWWYRPKAAVPLG